ncbi:MAG: hypothetical protein MJZ55_04865, partial [Paludibacteraceae bacterium]|nr:hypothetical protein [Paludibacteraceae bacterium]
MEQVVVSPKEAQELEQKYRIIKRSVDARQRELKVHLTICTDDNGHRLPIDAPVAKYTPPVYQDV